MGGFTWQVVSLKDDHVDEFCIESGNGHDLDKTLTAGGKALVKAAYSSDPCRYEWACDCGISLVIEARQSKRSPYTWESPREITCSCGQAYGVKLNFGRDSRGEPLIEALPR
jgi:hypothetical protein